MRGFAHLIGVGLERQHVEAAALESESRLRASEAHLHQALAHQEVLTREVSHRVKNSLTIVAGLLGMQGRTSQHPEVRQALAVAQTRVHTIAQLHDRMWRSEEHTINLADFMGELCEKLGSSAGTGHQLITEFSPVTIPTDQAMPLALLVNELVTNAFKYAYPEGGGVVRVSILQTTPALRLVVSDEGRGLPPNFAASDAKSLGMRLIGSLTRQLDGQAEWQNQNPGTSFTLDCQKQERPVL